MERFSTQRVIAERLDDRHLGDLTILHLDPEVMRYLGGVRTPATTRVYLDTNLDHWRRHNFGLWALTLRDGAFAGRAGIRQVTVEDTDEVEIAYTLARPFWGLGLASEIAKALTDIGLGPMGMADLVGVVSVGNTASSHVLEKVGYTLERPVRYYDDTCVLYRRRRPDDAKAD
jgi:RimJ/RimL family protein N-acetyltransferase